MLNFVQALFRRPQPETDCGEISRLKQMRSRTEGSNVQEAGESRDSDATVRDTVDCQPEASDLKGSALTKSGSHEAGARVVIGRGSTEQSQGVQQKWIDECGFKRPNTGKQR
jgi:hypothetical protein